MSEESKSSDESGVLDSELSALRITAVQIHEMFLELKAAGFIHKDAIQLIGIMLTSGVMFNPSATFGYSFEEMFNDEEDDEDESLEYGDGDDGDTII